MHIVKVAQKKYTATLCETIIFNAQQHKTVTYRAPYIRDMITLSLSLSPSKLLWISESVQKKLFIIKHLNEWKCFNTQFLLHENVAEEVINWLLRATIIAMTLKVILHRRQISERSSER